MTNEIVRFDQVVPQVEKVVREMTAALAGLQPLWLVRDLLGRVRVVVREQPEEDSQEASALRDLANRLAQELGSRAYPPERAILAAGDMAEAAVEAGEARQLEVPDLDVFLVDRQVTGQSWSSVAKGKTRKGEPQRITLYSIKGGVGRTTTAAVLATHLARQGKRVLLLDLDLEAPGLSTALLAPDEQPELGIVDWFVEDAVGQGDGVIASMTARGAVARDLRGEILVAPAHGKDAGEYLAKLGRVYLDLPPAGERKLPERWTGRLLRLLGALEKEHSPDVVLLDSRSGLHDLAAALVTDIEAFVLLFGAGSQQTFSAYKLLFRHWLEHGAAEQIRERVKMVAAMVPEIEPTEHVDRFREASWDLFRDHLYDQVQVEDAEGEAFSFDLNDLSGPHDPLPVYWHRGLAALPSLRAMEESTLQAAYASFLNGLDPLLPVGEEPSS